MEENPDEQTSGEEDVALEGDFLPDSEFGIEPPFQPQAVFDVIEEHPQASSDNLFDEAEPGEVSQEEDDQDETKETLTEEQELEMETDEEEKEEMLIEEEEEVQEEELKAGEGSEQTLSEGEEMEEGELGEVSEEGKVEEEESKPEEEEDEGEEISEEEEGEGEGEGIRVTKKKPRAIQFGTGDEGEEEQAAKPKATKRRMSIRKKSIFYQATSRFATADDRRISGDFAALTKDDILGVPTTSLSITSFEMVQEGMWYEEEIEEEELEEVPIDRLHYYNLHKSLTDDLRIIKLKNNFLQRRMADYFRKRKMEYVLKESSDQQSDAQYKYNKKLDTLSELKNVATRERNSIKSELDDLRNQRDEQLAFLNDHFTKMQNREKDIGTGLINTKTGKQISDKVVEHLLTRQKAKWNEVADLRLKYIKIRDKVNEKKTALESLDCIGENLYLIDYEQLKIENQSHTDKIEERDEDLTKLRVTCSTAVQCLAHVREKSAAATIDLQQLKERLEDVEVEYMEVRERLNFYKQERDNVRADTLRLIEDNGLLCKPKLLSDMESSMEELKVEGKKLEDLKAEHERLKRSTSAIKQHINELSHKLQKKAKGKMPGEKEMRLKSTRRIYKGRPTLIKPILDQSEWSTFD